MPVALPPTTFCAAATSTVVRCTMRGHTATIGHLLLMVLATLTTCTSARATSVRTAATAATTDVLSVAWLLGSCWWLGDNDKGIYCCADAPTGASFFL